METDGVGEEPLPTAGSQVVPLTKEAIEKFLRCAISGLRACVASRICCFSHVGIGCEGASDNVPGVLLLPACCLRSCSCQLDTHLNDASPRGGNGEHRKTTEEAWQQPPDLKKHSSGGPKSHHKSTHRHGNNDEAAQTPEVPGTVDGENDEDSKKRGEELRIALLQRRLADQERQTKMLMDRLQGRSNTQSTLISEGSVPGGVQRKISGVPGANRRGRDQKHRFEEALMDSAARARARTEARRAGGDSPHRRSETGRSGWTENSGHHSPRSNTHDSDSASHRDEGYSNDRAVDSIERGDSAAGGRGGGHNHSGRGRRKSGKDAQPPHLPGVDESKTLARTSSGTEIDLETGLPKTAKTGGVSWFYAIGFVVLVSVLIYASIIILQRYS